MLIVRTSGWLHRQDKPFYTSKNIGYVTAKDAKKILTEIRQEMEQKGYFTWQQLPTISPADFLHRTGDGLTHEFLAVPYNR
jgi:hypothetical protein